MGTTSDSAERGMFSEVPDAVAATEVVGGVTFADVLLAAQRLAAAPWSAHTAAMELWSEVMKIASGTSTLAPDARDWRFRHPAWSENPAFKGMAQFYLAWSDAAQKVADSTEAVDWRERERLQIGTSILTSALAPTNYLFTNPAALQRAFETAGASLVRGSDNYTRDLREDRSVPSQVDTSGFTVGENLAATPGGVVFRNEMCEVIEYVPSTAQVRERPLLIVPPPIGKYYFLDLAPGKSFVEHAVSQGLHVFIVSWRNPGPEHAHWDLDAYASSVIEALGVVCDVAESEDANLAAFCAGGIILSTVLSYLAAKEDQRAHAASFGVMLLDFDVPATIGAFSPATVLGAARGQSAKEGVLGADELATVFAWLRPNDLVWNYWVNNYLLGENPPAIDIMAWNADGTNLAAALHAQFLDIFEKNLLTKPGDVTVLGTPVDLSRVTVDTYCMGAINDHLTPWKACYSSGQLFGGSRRFVLSNAGHIASLVNPPTNPKARHFLGPPPEADYDTWLEQAEERQGTWWTDWAEWMVARSGEEQAAPEALGGGRLPVLCAAPGEYVHG